LDRLGTDYGKPDGSPSDADAGVDSDARAGDAAPVYNDINNKDFWKTVDITSFYTLAHDFAGGVFDGQYVYFSPSASGVVARHEVGKDLYSIDAWSVFDTANLGARGFFFGAVFDGRYVYFVPYKDTGVPHGVVVGFDTTSSFGFRDTGSWKVFDVSVGRGGLSAAGFVGGVFDGQYVYLVPYSGRIVMRHDTRQPFEAGWDGVNVTSISPGQSATTYAGGIFDGRSVYLVPGVDVQFCYAAKYNTQDDFQGHGWEFFVTTSLNQNAYYFFGGAFDGKHWYLSPYRAPSPSVVAQYDTQEDFQASWRWFDTARVDPDAKAFAGAAFDGRYVYFVPSGASKRLVTRFDTGADFQSVESWSKFDVLSVDPAAPSFAGAVFDGRYLYFVPASGGIVARFDAKNPPAMPNLPAFHGSFL
jgi:hypothetical protein